MNEIEIISPKDNKEKVLGLSIEELNNYKKELMNMINFIENEINKRKDQKNIADKFFKK
tara:strand:- start:12803 stop:12979 length:177 start_codon:yes stop_codon:yes gene_type:complete